MSRPITRPGRAGPPGMPPTLLGSAPTPYPDAALLRAADRLAGPAGGDLARHAADVEYATALGAWRQARAQLDRLLPGQP